MKDEQRSALSKDGESPANQENAIIAAMRTKKLVLLPKILLPRIPDSPEKNDRCIPLRARTWESEKSLQRPLSVYSLAPESRESISPPAFPQPKSILLKTSLHFALKWAILPERLLSGSMYSRE